LFITVEKKNKSFFQRLGNWRTFLTRLPLHAQHSEMPKSRCVCVLSRSKCSQVGSCLQVDRPMVLVFPQSSAKSYKLSSSSR